MLRRPAPDRIRAGLAAYSTIRNTQGSSARGLFQLTKVNYNLLPRGEASFGNAVEECQGGIRYVVGRYGTAAAARKFWEKRLWY